MLTNAAATARFIYRGGGSAPVCGFVSFCWVVATARMSMVHGTFTVHVEREKKREEKKPSPGFELARWEFKHSAGTEQADQKEISLTWPSPPTSKSLP